MREEDDQIAQQLNEIITLFLVLIMLILNNKSVLGCAL